MTTDEYAAYEEMAQIYLGAFTALRNVPPASAELVKRAAGDIPAETLIDRADEIADASASMVILSTPYIESPDPVLREGISGQLIAQAAAELELATELLQIAEEEDGRTPPVTRAVRGAQLRDAISALESSMAVSVDQGLPSALPTTRAAVKPETIEVAGGALENSASVTTGAITRRVQELGGDIALNLILNTEWTAVASGATLLSKDIAKILEEVKKGAGALFARAVTAAAKTLLNVYDKILALLGKDVEDLARKKVEEWLEKCKEQDNVDLFDALVNQFYGVDAFKKELPIWIAETDADVDSVNDTTDQVDALAGKFATLAGRLAALETAVVLAKFIKIPQVLLVIAGIQVALLAVVVYSGFDYIGYKEPRFPNLTKGVAEVIREGLASTMKADSGD